MINISNSKISIFCQKAIMVLTVLCAFVLIFFNTKSIFPLIIPKTIMFRIVVELMTIFYLILIYVDKQFLPKWTKLNIAILIFAIISLISGFLGVSPSRSMFSTAERMNGNFGLIHFVALIFILSSVINNKNSWVKILKSWTLIYAITNLFCFIASRNPNSMIQKYNSEPTRYVGLTGNSTFAGVFLLLNAFLCLYLFFEQIEQNNSQTQNSKTRVNTILFFILFLFNSFLLFLTGCRGSMLSWLTSMGILLITLIIFDYPKLNKFFHINIKKWATVLIVIFITAIIILFSLRDTKFIQNIMPLQRLTSITIFDASSTSRLIVSNIAIKSALQKPLLGWGPENFEIAYQRNFNTDIVEVLPLENRFDKVHNMILEIFVTTGIIGLISYLCIFYVAYKELKNINSINFWPKIILAICILSYFIQNIFLFDVIEGYLLLFMIFAFISSQSTPIKTKFKPTKITVPHWLQTIILIIVCAILCFTIYNYNVLVFITATKHKKAESLIQSGQIEQGITAIKEKYNTDTFINNFLIYGDLELLSNGDLTKFSKTQIEDTYLFINQQLDKLIKQEPLNLKLYIAKLVNILSKLRWNKNLTPEDIQLAKYTKTSIDQLKLTLPDTDIYFLQILINSPSKQDQLEAVKLLKQFHATYPKIAIAPWILGNYLVNNNQYQEGLQYLKKAIKTGPIFNSFQSILNGIDTFIKVGDIDTALQIAQYTEKQIKNEPALYLKLAQIYLQQKNEKEALNSILRAKYLYDIYPTLKTPKIDEEMQSIMQKLSK